MKIQKEKTYKQLSKVNNKNTERIPNKPQLLQDTYNKKCECEKGVMLLRKNIFKKKKNGNRHTFF